MKVWILLHIDARDYYQTDTNRIGVFSSQELAMDAYEKASKTTIEKEGWDKGHLKYPGGLDADLDVDVGFHIEEVEVDEISL